ncbi:hypothetical protein C8R43DRAFT_1135073 [Mycena crocata]|nr:hypothetical protein C8R43DRAFT_1135073 [Mycena crocata]
MLVFPLSHFMAEETWHSLDLSSLIQATSNALANLQSDLPDRFLESNVLKSRLETLETHISELQRALATPNTIHSHCTIPGPGSSPAVQKLAETALKTLWDDVPLSAIMNAHKHKADRLRTSDSEGINNEKVYVEYCKVLHLHPGPRDGPEFRQLYKRVHHLEIALANQNTKNNVVHGTKANEIPSPPVVPVSQSPPSVAVAHIEKTAFGRNNATVHQGKKVEKSFMTRLGVASR